MTDHIGKPGRDLYEHERQIAREKAGAVTEQEAEDARQLQEFEAFLEVLRGRPEANRAGVASHVDVGAVAADPEQTVSDACYILLSGEAAVYVGQDKIADRGSGRGDRRIGAQARQIARGDGDDEGARRCCTSIAMISTACSRRCPRCVESSMPPSRDACQAAVKASAELTR